MELMARGILVAYVCFYISLNRLFVFIFLLLLRLINYLLFYYCFQCSVGIRCVTRPTERIV